MHKSTIVRPSIAYSVIVIIFLSSSLLASIISCILHPSWVEGAAIALLTVLLVYTLQQAVYGIIVLNEEGFRRRLFFGSYFVRWKDIASLDRTDMLFFSMITWDLRHGVPPLPKFSRVNKSLMNHQYGFATQGISARRIFSVMQTLWKNAKEK